jgi:hypothetical protein
VRPAARLRKQLDELAIESRKVVGLAAGHETAVHHDLLVSPLRAGIADVRLQRGPGGLAMPFAAPLSITVQGPWQIAATGLPASKNDLTNATAPALMRNASGFMTPPGSTSAS